LCVREYGSSCNTLFFNSNKDVMNIELLQHSIFLFFVCDLILACCGLTSSVFGYCLRYLGESSIVHSCRASQDLSDRPENRISSSPNHVSLPSSLRFLTYADQLLSTREEFEPTTRAGLGLPSLPRGISTYVLSRVLYTTIESDMTFFTANQRSQARL
jgi:hypothetical protein